MTTDAEREQFEKTLRTKKTANCPLCGHTSRIYKRPFSLEMVTFLRELHAHELLQVGSSKAPLKPVHVRKFMPGNANATKAASDGSLLVHWRLVKRHQPGVYSTTELGRDFLHGKVEIQLEIHILGGRCIGCSGPWVDIKHKFKAYGKKDVHTTTPTPRQDPHQAAQSARRDDVPGAQRPHAIGNGKVRIPARGHRSRV